MIYHWFDGAFRDEMQYRKNLQKSLRKAKYKWQKERLRKKLQDHTAFLVAQKLSED